MVAYSRQSLELLRTKVDLVEVLSSHLKMQKSGGYYKTCCPFHQEKSPSFMIQRGDSHYHCYGCGAHGDAITFLTDYLKLTFQEAVEHLAEKFHVRLETVQDHAVDYSTADLKNALHKLHRFYQCYLLYTDEGRVALKYLFERGFTLDFIHKFGLGFAPSAQTVFLEFAKQSKISIETLEKIGCIKVLEGKKIKAYFHDRVVIPIYDPSGNPIAFSCRKIKEETFGPKYINSPETVLFKKSQILFGLSFSRKKIAKERKALIVEGQFDALRLIDAGFDFTVAGQGTAFGEMHVKELVHLGVKNVYLAFDGDDAGQEAAIKVGQLFQKVGVEVWVIQLDRGKDPDLMIRELGPKHFEGLMTSSKDYMSFIVNYFSLKGNPTTPAGKNEIMRTIVAMIKEWEHPLMVHEGYKRLSQLLQIPQSILDPNMQLEPDIEIKQTASIIDAEVDPVKILEFDLLRWLLLLDPADHSLYQLIFQNIRKEDFLLSSSQMLFEKISQFFEKNAHVSMLQLAQEINSIECRLIMTEILQKKVNVERKEEGVKETLQKILERNWLNEREKIKLRIHKGGMTDSEIMELAKQFDNLKAKPPFLKQV
jgi:DNA primase